MRGRARGPRAPPPLPPPFLFPDVGYPHRGPRARRLRIRACVPTVISPSCPSRRPRTRRLRVCACPRDPPWAPSAPTAILRASAPAEAPCRPRRARAPRRRPPPPSASLPPSPSTHAQPTPPKCADGPAAHAHRNTPKRGCAGDGWGGWGVSTRVRPVEAREGGGAGDGHGCRRRGMCVPEGYATSSMCEDDATCKRPKQAQSALPTEKLM